MAGASTPANPGTTSTAPACKGTPGLGPSIECRSRATGQESEYLVEAAARLESVTALLTTIALDHVQADIGEVLPPVIAVLDDTARFVHLAGEP